jgi:hypothetical protein
MRQILCYFGAAPLESGMIRLPITEAAFEAIKAAMPLGPVASGASG